MITNLNLKMLLMTMWIILMRILVRCVYMMLRKRLNLPMLLMRGMMTKFMLTSIFGEPNDYTLEKFGKADGKNGYDWS